MSNQQDLPDETEIGKLIHIHHRIEFIIQTCTDPKVKLGLEQALRVVRSQLPPDLVSTVTPPKP